METVVWLTAATAVWLVVTWFFWKAEAWLPYYVVGAAGCALVLVVGAREVFPGEFWLRSATAHTVNFLAGLIGVGTQVTRSDPGSLLILGVRHDNEWTHLSVGLESSGLLEGAALFGLIMFFPAQGLRRRALVMIGALLATFAANLLRVLIIVGAVAYGGQALLDVAHIFLGRVVFFGIAVLIYWYAITRPTLRTVSARLREG